MADNRYQLAGWVAIAQAIVFVAGIVTGILEAIASAVLFHRSGMALGPSDLLSLAGACMVIYTMTMFRRLLNERYDFHEVDVLITLSIVWNVIFSVAGILIGVVYFGLRMDQSPLGALVFILPFFAVMMITGGVIDILIGVRLLRIKERLSDLVRTMAYLSLIGGICAVSLVFAPVAALIGLATWIVLGLIFLREPDEPEFV